jgi:molecular chaperone GrpE (heat shock protein)
VIRDLISLYDDLSGIHGQVADIRALASNAEGDGAKLLLDRLDHAATNIAHNCDFILEVLARLDAEPMPRGTGKLDKRTQSVVLLESAQSPAEDGFIARTLKRGFVWKGRVVRAEEVVMKRWKEATAVESASQK